MTENILSPLEWHYKSGQKIDYFVLSVALALLGWTVVNTDWLPEGQLYVWLMAAFWLLIIVSIICGIIRQLYIGMTFGVNHQFLRSSELADLVEKSTVQGGPFIDQQTGERIGAEEFRKKAVPLRHHENKGREIYKKYEKRASIYGNLEKAALVIGPFVLVCTKLLALQA